MNLIFVETSSYIFTLYIVLTNSINKINTYQGLQIILAFNYSPLILTVRFKYLLYSVHVSKTKHNIIMFISCCLSSPENKYWSQVIPALEKCFTFKLNNFVFPCSLQQANYISGYFTVDTENIFEEDAGDVLLLVKVARHVGVVPDDLTHVHHLHTDILVSSPSADSSQSSFLKVSL